MRTRIFTLLVAFLAIAGNAVWGQGTSLTGEGTPENPYQISNADDLKAFRDLVNDGDADACAILTDNIELDSSEEWEPIGYADNTSFKYSYTGTFDGYGHTISGLCIGSDPQSIGSGLFRVVGIFDMWSFDKQKNGIVKNLIVEGNVGSISTNMNGIICGINIGTIQNCINNISGGDNKLTSLGGICGANYGSIIGCVNTGDITAGSVGGISAINYEGKIEQCYNKGNISATGYQEGSFDLIGLAGGISAETGNGSSIFNCYNTGEIKSTNYAAGITYIPNNTDAGASITISIKNCHNYGTLEGNLNEAGICCIGSLYENISIENNYYKDDIAEYGLLYVSGSYETPDTDESKTKAKSADAFANGEVLYLLQQNNPDVWVQTIGTDDYPKFETEGQGSTIYQIAFDYNYEGSPEAIAYYIEEGESVTVPTMTRDGYIFTNWSTDKAGETIAEISGSITPDASVTYYAQWQAEQTEEPEQPSDDDDEDQSDTGIHKPQRPIKYYNIYIDTICPGLNVEVSKDVVQEGHQVSAYLTIQAECDTTGMRFEYKRGLFGYWKDLKELEGVQPGEYIIKNIYTDIYIRALDATLPEEEPTGIDDLEGVKAYAKEGSIYVYTPNREEVTIISMSGAIIKHAEQVGLQSYSVSRGIYIVRVGEKVFKLKN